jgi:hypothetical protein
VQLCTAETIKGCVSLKKYESQGKTVEGTLNSKEETIKTFVWFVQDFGLRLTLILAARAEKKLPNVYLFTEDQSKELKI